MNASVEITGHLRTRDLIVSAYGRGAAKKAARAAGVSVRTAQDWMQGRSSPRLDVALRWAERCDRWAAVIEGKLNAERVARARGENAARAGESAASAR